MSRKTVSITETAYDRLAACKDGDESFTDVVHRLVDAQDDTEHTPNTVAASNVDEIARATADELEDRLTTY